mmetsp:Transcript_37417/g.112165  ORF Transcript_37417/g.112165 Transcript_37417/m.112165 type:complete len:240 (-) Transcript_37417:802-1521(-)
MLRGEEGFRRLYIELPPRRRRGGGGRKGQWRRSVRGREFHRRGHGRDRGPPSRIDGPPRRGSGGQDPRGGQEMVRRREDEESRRRWQRRRLGVRRHGSPVPVRRRIIREGRGVQLDRGRRSAPAGRRRRAVDDDDDDDVRRRQIRGRNDAGSVPDEAPPASDALHCSMGSRGIRRCRSFRPTHPRDRSGADGRPLRRGGGTDLPGGRADIGPRPDVSRTRIGWASFGVIRRKGLVEKIV